MEVRDREGDPAAVRERHLDPMGGPVPPEIDALRLGGGQRLADEDAVAVFRPACPATNRPVVTRPGRAEQPVLLERIHAFLETEQVGLQRRHVREEKRQALVPAVGQVAQVESGDVQLVHRSGLLRDKGQGEGEGRAFPLGRVDPDPAAVLLDNVPCDRQAEAGSHREPPRAPAPGRPCRSVRRSAVARPAGCRSHDPARMQPAPGPRDERRSRPRCRSG